ncbi:uncharacterized protein LOC135489953 [Lineus longissimus]|uniref:uncharacterized protein LOC135489953 n=1 Tax=Lineus longissimus TaxID=88925 RepID=UPI00315CA9AD
MLLDTGAALTLVSGDLWRRCPSSSGRPLQEVDASLQSATGEELKILGMADVPLGLGSSQFSHPVVVVENLAHECLLGSDFLQAQGCSIDYRTATLEVAGNEVPLRNQQGVLKVCRVIMGRNTRIPAGTEMILAGKLSRSRKESHLTPGLIEAQKGTIGFTTGRSLVSSDYGKMPVRVANFTDKPIFIRACRTIGWFHPVAEVGSAERILSPGMDGSPPVDKEGVQNLNNCSAGKTKVETTPEQPSTLEDEARLGALLEKLEVTELGLSGQQTEAVIDLVRRHQNVFSMGDFDLGQTHIAEHTIDTEGAQPIKQRPR